MAEQWIQIDNARVKATNGRFYSIDSIHDQIQDGRIQIVQPPVDEKPKLIARIREQINQYRDAIVISDFEHKGSIFEADERSVTNMKEKLLEIALLDPGAAVVWIDKADKPVPMNHDEFKAMLMAIGKRKNDAFLRANVLKTGLSRKSVNTLKSYSVATEW